MITSFILGDSATARRDFFFSETETLRVLTFPISATCGIRLFKSSANQLPSYFA